MGVVVVDSMAAKSTKFVHHQPSVDYIPVDASHVTVTVTTVLQTILCDMLLQLHTMKWQCLRHEMSHLFCHRDKLNKAPSLLSSSFKVKSATNKTDGSDSGKQTGAQTNQDSRNGKAATRPAPVAHSPIPSNAAGDDDDDGIRRPPTGAYKKRLGCDGPRKDQSDSSQVKEETSDEVLPPVPPNKGGFDLRQTGAIPNRKAGGDGDAALRIPQVSAIEENQDEAGNSQSILGATGDAPPSDQHSARSPQLTTPRHEDRIVRSIQDDGLSVPVNEVRFRSRAAAMSSEQQSGVIYGEPRNVIALAERLKKQQFSSSGHEGVLLDRRFIIERGSYREGHQFSKEKNLGSGSYGRVYLIRDTKTKKGAVGKYVLLAKFAPNEAVLWCQLTRSCIVQFLGLVRTDSEVMFLSEYNPNYRTLQSLVDRRVIGQGQALALTKPLFQALEYLHENNIIHKDIHPKNILVKVGHLGIMVIDFGLSVKLSSPKYTDDGSPRGHLAYMAPEIERGEPYDCRADVWSAICILMFLLKQRDPWTQKTDPDFGSVDVPQTTHPELRQFIQWVLTERPTASQVLKRWPGHLEEEPYSIPAVEKQNPVANPRHASVAIPDRGPVHVTGPPMDNYSPPELADSAQSGQQSDDGMDVNVGDPQVSSDSVNVEEDLANRLADLMRDDTGDRDARPPVVKGIFVNIHDGSRDLVRMKIPPHFTAVTVAQALYEEIRTTPLTLHLRSGGPIESNHTFSCGEHFLIAMAAPDGGDWLWRVNNNGQVDMAEEGEN